jgi:hypothetical protein
MPIFKSVDYQISFRERMLSCISIKDYLIEPAIPLEPSVGVLSIDPTTLFPHLEGPAALGLVLVHLLVVDRGSHLSKYSIG